MPALRVLALFFVSGACGLIYQVVWMRALSLTLSISVYAVTTVLVAFMFGLGLGAAIAGRIADRLRRPLLAFGLAEIGVGLLGIVSLGFLFDLGPAYAWLHAVLGGEGLAFLLARFLLACSVLLLPCTLMGTTLPLLSRAVIGREDVVGLGAGALYAINTLGAVVGCVIAGFALIPAAGLSRTTLAAATLNLAVGLTAIVLAGRMAPVKPIDQTVDVRKQRITPLALLAAVGFGVSGFTAMGYEVLWTRALEQFTHNSTYAYTAMLATFLVGIALGSALAAWLADRTPRPLATLGMLEIGIAISVMVSLLVYTRLLDWIPAASTLIGGLESWGRVVFLIFVIAGVVLLPMTLLFGATFPFVARAVVDSMDLVGRRIAFAYTVNTIGSILGAVVVGFVILPAVGMQGSFITLILTNLAAGAVLVLAGSPRRLAISVAGLAAAGAAFAFAVLPSDLFKQVYVDRYGKLLMYREQVTDIVMVTEDKRGRVIRYGDGRGTAGTMTVREDRSYAHLALLPHPDPKRVLSICFGVGNSLSSVAQYPVDRIDSVELSPGVAHAARFFRKTNRDVLRDPRVKLTIQDGRNFLLASRERYDVIRLDPPELHTAGVVNLYTKEFFELARDHLAKGGIFSIWVNIAYTPVSDVKMILRTAAEVFPHVTVWHGPWLYSWVINGSVDPRPPDLELIQQKFEDPRIRADLETIPIRDPFALLNLFVMADDEVREFAGDAAVITDDRTRLDFDVARSKESFFGIANSQTDYYLADALRPEVTVLERAVKYCDYKRPVFPHLVNLEAAGVEPEEARAKLAAQLGSLPSGCVGIAQAKAAGSGGQ